MYKKLSSLKVMKIYRIIRGNVLLKNLDNWYRIRNFINYEVKVNYSRNIN